MAETAKPDTERGDKVIVIWNPGSGTSDEEFRESIEKGLARRGVQYELRATTPEVDGSRLAAEAIEQGASHLLACGGDGTVMGVVNGIAQADGGQAKTRLSIIPGGTANLLATALKIPVDTDEAVEVAVRGEDAIIDLGRCGEHYFALGLGLGLTGRMVSQTSSREKERWGRLAYAWALLKELGSKPTGFTLSLDGAKPVRRFGVAVVVANAGEIGGKLRFAPDAKMDDGLLDVCILRRFYLRDVLRMLISSLWGDVRRDRAVDFLQAARIELSSRPPLDLQIDGEEVERQMPLVAEVVPAALKVRVPAKQGAGEPAAGSEAG